MREYKVIFKKLIEKKINGKAVLIGKESTKSVYAKTKTEAEAKAKRFASWTGLKIMDIEEYGFCRGI